MTEIIEQAEKLGYGIEHLINNNEYINLCLIQKWLRDEKGVDIDVTCNYEDYDLEIYFDKSTHLHFATYGIDTYEQALEQGILHALKELEE